MQKMGGGGGTGTTTQCQIATHLQLPSSQLVPRPVFHHPLSCLVLAPLPHTHSLSLSPFPLFSLNFDSSSLSFRFASFSGPSEEEEENDEDEEDPLLVCSVGTWVGRALWPSACCSSLPCFIPLSEGSGKRICCLPYRMRPRVPLWVLEFFSSFFDLCIFMV